MGVSLRDGARLGLAWLAHPFSLVALGVLIVNDHVLKAAWPGPLTGKLSDVAGLMVAPALVAAVVLLAARRLAPNAVAVASIALTAAGFVWVKATATGAWIASAAWSAVSWQVVGEPSVVHADPTDLLALPALAIAWYAWTRARRSPVPGRAARLVRVGVILPMALLGVAATSAFSSGRGVAVDVLSWNDSIVLVESGGAVGDAGEASAVRDPLSEWRTPTRVERETLRRVDFAQRSSYCVPATNGGLRCYRVVPGQLMIEQSDDGGATWVTSFAIDPIEQERIARARQSLNFDPHLNFACVSVIAVPIERGHLTLAACGAAGFVERKTIGIWDGNWKRIGLPPASPPDARIVAPPPLKWFNWPGFVNMSLIGWFIFVVGYEVIGARRTWRYLFGLACLLTLAWLPARLGVDQTYLELIVIGLIWLAGLLTAIGSLVGTAYPRDVPIRAWPFGLTALLVAIANNALYSSGNTFATDPAAAQSAIIVISTVGLLVSVALGIWLPKRTLAAERRMAERKLLHERTMADRIMPDPAADRQTSDRSMAGATSGGGRRGQAPTSGVSPARHRQSPQGSKTEASPTGETNR